jgi:DUF1365 family protein
LEIAPQIFTANVMHKRLAPRVNQFTYGVYYVALPLLMNTSRTSESDDPGSCDETPDRSDERSGCGQELERSFRLPVCEKVLCVRQQDYGPRDGTALEPWARAILSDYGLNEKVANIMLITMPRILGYGFNPVSFWMCLDDTGALRAVLSEVHNTFGEAHSYLCAHPDHRPIAKDDWLEAEKLFHVSPFLPRVGSYRFRFALADEKLGIWIDYHDEHGNPQLLTSLIGTLSPLSKASLRRAFWSHPLVTFKTITLIHWQALKLFRKGIRYIVKPLQKQTRISSTTDLTKM